MCFDTSGYLLGRWERATFLVLGTVIAEIGWQERTRPDQGREWRSQLALGSSPRVGVVGPVAALHQARGALLLHLARVGWQMQFSASGSTAERRGSTDHRDPVLLLHVASASGRPVYDTFYISRA